MSKTVSDNAPFGANSPFFRIIKEGLEGLADGEDYFDLLAEDVVFEYVISVPGYPGGSKDGRTSSTSTATMATTWRCPVRTTSAFTGTPKPRWSSWNTKCTARRSKPAAPTTTASSRSSPSRTAR